MDPMIGDVDRLRSTGLKRLLLLAVTAMLLSACGTPASPNDNSRQASGQDSGGERSGQQVSSMPEETIRPEPTLASGSSSPMPETTLAEENSPSSGSESVIVPPEDTTLALTIPKAEDVENVTVPSVEADEIDEEDPYNELANNVAVHLDGTGFPWQEEANIYLVGHSLGFEGTPSRLALWDLIDLEEDDPIYLTDADGRRYTYRVYSAQVAEEDDLDPFETIEGKNILSIQSFTLEDTRLDEEARYSDRMWVWQAELTEIAY